jgi:hypothetical protein
MSEKSFLVGIALLWTSLAAPLAAQETVTFSRDVKFIDTNGREVTVQPGEYTVTSERDSLVLTQGRTRWQLRATSGTINERVDSLVPLLIPRSGDLVHLVVMLRLQRRLEAVGSYNRAPKQAQPLPASEVGTLYKGVLDRDAMFTAYNGWLDEPGPVPPDPSVLAKCLSAAQAAKNRCNSVCEDTAKAICQAVCGPSCLGWGRCVRKCKKACQPLHEGPCKVGCNSAHVTAEATCNQLYQ